MSNSWYKKSMPSIQDLNSLLPELKEAISSIDGVKDIHIFGEFYENQDKPNYRLADLDVLLKTSFYSEDLIAVDRSSLSMRSDILEEEGFDVATVKFSKSLLKSDFNINPWVISCDNKLLHWGPIGTSPDESTEVNKKAEKYATEESGYSRDKLKKASESVRKNWYSSYKEYYSNHFADMPLGWYPSEASIEDILEKSKQL